MKLSFCVLRRSPSEPRNGPRTQGCELALLQPTGDSRNRIDQAAQRNGWAPYCAWVNRGRGAPDLWTIITSSAPVRLWVSRQPVCCTDRSLQFSELWTAQKHTFSHFLLRCTKKENLTTGVCGIIVRMWLNAAQTKLPHTEEHYYSFGLNTLRLIVVVFFLQVYDFVS